MAYCQFCGTKLEEGQVCTCEMAQAAAKQPPFQQSPAQQPPVQTAPAAKNQVTTTLDGLKTFLTTYISAPARAVRSEAESASISLAVTLTVIRLLAMGLSIYGLLNRLCSTALSYITTSLLSYGSPSDILTADMSVSFPKCLIFGALIAAAGMLLFVVMVFALASIQGVKVSFSYVFKASAANGILSTALLLLSFLFSFVSAGLCVLFIALAMLSWMICGVLTTQVVCPDAHTGTFWLMYFIGVVLVIVAGYFIVPWLFMRAVGGIDVSYMGRNVNLQSIFDTASSGLNSFFKELEEEGVTSLGTFFGKLTEVLSNSLVSELWYSIFQ